MLMVAEVPTKPEGDENAEQADPGIEVAGPLQDIVSVADVPADAEAADRAVEDPDAKADAALEGVEDDPASDVNAPTGTPDGDPKPDADPEGSGGMFAGMGTAFTALGEMFKDFFEKLQAIFKKNKKKAKEIAGDLVEDVLGQGGKVIEAVEKALKENLVGEHCWDGVDQVYKMAGFDLRNGANKIFDGAKGKAEGELRDSVPDAQLVEDGSPLRLRAGDHLYIHNGNKDDVVGDHSLIFLGWVNEGERVARTASVRAANRPLKLGERNLRETPVTFISRPIEPITPA
jgi:hypothetical protein